MPLLLKNATLVSGKKCDLLIEEGRISKIARSISVSADEKLDAKGKLLLPGFVNTHTHAAMSLFRGMAEDMELHSWLSCVRAAEVKLSAPQVGIGTSLACAEMIKGGTTCFSDMYFHMDAAAAAVQKSGMRAVLGYGMVDLGDEKKRKSELSIAEKFVKDWNGKANGRIKCSIAPHSLYLCSAELLQAANELSKKHSIPYHIHLSETREEVFDCLSKNGKRPAHYLDSLGVLSHRAVAAHSVWLTNEEVRLLSSRKVSASLNPASNCKLAGGSAAPMPDMQKFGMNISLGTDGCASNNSLSMFEAMKFCALLQKNSRWDARVARAGSIFTAATLGGAHALGIHAGGIREGKLADLILLDAKSANLSPVHDWTANIVYSANAGNVTDAIINGKIVMKDRKLLTINEEKLVEQAQKEAEKLAAASG